MAFLTAVLAAPSSARAGCDYPTHIERRPVADFAGKPRDEAKLPSKPRPCSGQTCGRKPLLPAPPSQTESVPTQEWGHLVPRLLLVSPHHHARPPEDSIESPVRRVASVYRPPRLLS